MPFIDYHLCGKGSNSWINGINGLFPWIGHSLLEKSYIHFSPLDHINNNLFFLCNHHSGETISRNQLFVVMQRPHMYCFQIEFLARMHSSRMRTVRNSSHLLSWGGGVSIPLEQAPPRSGTSIPQSSPPPSRHPPSQSRPPPQKPTPRHAGIPPAMHAGIAHPSPVNRMTDRCKNITFATSLRTLIMQKKSLHVLAHLLLSPN